MKDNYTKNALAALRAAKSASKKANQNYPDVKLYVMVHLYGTPGKVEEIKKICDEHGILIIEDACESFGAKYKLNGKWAETGTLGDYNCISFNGNKIITGSAGGMFLTDSKEDADKVRKWSTQSRENAFFASARSSPTLIPVQ